MLKAEIERKLMNLQARLNEHEDQIEQIVEKVREIDEWIAQVEKVGREMVEKAEQIEEEYQAKAKILFPKQ